MLASLLKGTRIKSYSVPKFIKRHLLNITIKMLLAIARFLNLENFRDIPLRTCGTSSYNTEIAKALMTL